MRYNLEDIKEDVRIALDENQVSDNMMDTDTLSVDDIIVSKIVEAVRDVHINAPTYMLEAGHNFADSICWDKKPGKGSGWTILPNDFMRLVSFRMSDWERPVYSAILPEDPAYALQSSRYGVKGNRQKPVCAIVMRPQGRVLEFYSCNGRDVHVSMAVYLPLPKIEDESIDICERCYRSVVYRCAGLAATSIERADKAEVLFKISNDLLK